MSPTSLGADDTANEEYLRGASPDRDYYRDPDQPYNNNTLKLDNESLVMSHLDSKEEHPRDEHPDSVYEQGAPGNRTASSHYKDNYETTFDLDGNVETKSICSAKSGGSGHDNRYLETFG